MSAPVVVFCRLCAGTRRWYHGALAQWQPCPACALRHAVPNRSGAHA